jgi:hypothetical protein
MKTFLLSLIMLVFCFCADAQVDPTHLPIATATCGCSTTGWSAITAYIGPNKYSVNCGYQFNVKKAQYVKLVGTYTCSGGCAPKYIVILKKADGTILQNTSMTTFAWGYTFPDYGGYRLEVTPICNGNKCATCTFYFTMNP